VAVSALRSVDFSGGFDAFLLEADDSKLSPVVLRIKKHMKKIKQEESIDSQYDSAAGAI
jgi:ribosomal protein L28